MSKIGTKENLVADFLSRNFCSDDATSFFARNDLGVFSNVIIPDEFFELKADW